MIINIIKEKIETTRPNLIKFPMVIAFAKKNRKKAILFIFDIFISLPIKYMKINPIIYAIINER